MTEPDHGEPPTGGSGGLFTDAAAGGGAAAGSRYDDVHMILRSSEMPDVSSADTSARECNVSNPEIEGGDVESGRAGRATLLPCGTVVEMEVGRWDREVTLAQPWRSHTLKGLSEDCIAHWTDSNEAEFRDGMYHSGFKWRVFMMSSLAFSVCLMALVDPCLTMLGALTCPFQLLLLSTQIAAQRVVEKRRGRQLGQRSLILICIGFACSVVPIAQYSSSGGVITWKGDTCTYEERATNHPMHVVNLTVAPFTLFVGVMVTFMTISTRGFVAMVTGFLMPATAAYFLRDVRHRSNL